MSHSASGRLKSAAIDLEASMGRVRDVWRDGKAQDFHERHIAPMLRSVEVGCLAMDEIASIVNQMKRECGPPGDGIF